MSATSLKSKPRPWWLTLILGIFAVVIGATLLWAPTKTAVNAWFTLIALLGLYWLITGILDIVSIFFDRSAWGWKLFIGIVSIIAGGYILMYPIAAGVALPRIFVFVLGLWGLFYGIVLLLMAFRGGGWGAGILGALAIVFGLVLLGSWSDLFSGLSMIWAAAVMGVIGGIWMIFMAFRARSAPPATT